MYYRLEFSQKQNCFHYENPNKNNKNTNGYYCLCDLLHLKYCLEFCKYIDKKYTNPTLGIVKLEFEIFFIKNPSVNF